jgi:hypothetical protein
MTNKENKGGFLSNEQVEQDNKVKGKQEAAYTGAGHGRQSGQAKRD